MQEKNIVCLSFATSMDTRAFTNPSEIWPCHNPPSFAQSTRQKLRNLVRRASPKQGLGMRDDHDTHRAVFGDVEQDLHLSHRQAKKMRSTRFKELRLHDCSFLVRLP